VGLDKQSTNITVDTATISAGDTSVTVTHGMSGTPKVTITATTEIGGRDAWVSDVGATTFKINVSSIDLSADFTFNWLGMD